MHLYADEDFSYPVVIELRKMGHDVVTAQRDGFAGSSDSVILARAFSLNRAVLTYNRGDFERLDRQRDPHVGILSATHDNDFLALAVRIHNKLLGLAPGLWCVRVNKTP